MNLTFEFTFFHRDRLFIGVLFLYFLIVKYKKQEKDQTSANIPWFTKEIESVNQRYVVAVRLGLYVWVFSHGLLDKSCLCEFCINSHKIYQP